MDITREVRLDGMISGSPEGSGHQGIAVTAQGEISRSELGVTGAGVLEAAGAVVSDRVKLVLETPRSGSRGDHGPAK